MWIPGLRDFKEVRLQNRPASSRPTPRVTCGRTPLFHLIVVQDLHWGEAVGLPWSNTRLTDAEARAGGEDVPDHFHCHSQVRGGTAPPSPWTLTR